MSESLATKLAQVMSEVDHVAKRGRNTAQGYDYVKASDVAHAVRSGLAARNVFMASKFTVTREYSYTTVKGTVMHGIDVHLTASFMDGDSDARIESEGLGSGTDSGDKAIFKAQTGALKYALRTAFLIPDDTDPENEGDAKTTWAEGLKAQATVAAKKIESLKQQVESSKALPLDQQLTGPQRNKLYAESADAGRDLHAWIKEKYGFDSVKQIHKDKLDSVIDDLRKAAIPKTKSKAGEGQPLATPENQVQPLLRLSLLLAKLHKADPTQDLDVILGGFLRTKDDKPVTYAKLKTLAMSAAKEKWIDDACARMEKEFADMLKEPETTNYGEVPPPQIYGDEELPF